MKELVKNTGIYIITSGFAQGLIFFLWVVLAWWLVPEQIGLYALVMFIIEFFSAFNIFGLDSAITRFYYGKESIASIFSNALVILVASSFCSALLFSLTARVIPLVITGLSDILNKNLLLFSSIIFTNTLVNFSLAHYSALKKSLAYAKIQLSKVLVFCLLAVIFVRFGWGILGVFYALLLSSLGTAILFVTNVKDLVSFNLTSTKIIKYLLSYAFPMMLYLTFSIIISYFSRFLLDRYTNLSTLGVYSFFLTLTLQVNGLWSSFNRAWTPEIFSQFLVDKKRALDNVKFMVFFSCFFYLIVMAAIIILGNLFLFKLIFKEIYLSNIYLFYIILLVPFFTGIYTAAYPLYYYENRTKRILAISLAVSGVNILLSLFLVKAFGLRGAAISYLTVIILYVIVYLLAFKKAMKIPPEIINWTFFLSALMAFAVGILLKSRSSVLFVIFIIFAAVLAYIFGDLSKKKYLLFNLVNELKHKLIS